MDIGERVEQVFHHIYLIYSSLDLHEWIIAYVDSINIVGLVWN